MPSYDRLSLLISLVLLGLVLASLIELPLRTFSWLVLGSPLSLTLSGSSLLAGLLAALTCAGVEGIVRSHPEAEAARTRYTFTFWILPALLTLAGAVLLPRLLPYPRLWLGGLAAMGLFLALVVMGEYLTLDPDDPRSQRARLGLNLVTYVAALVLYTAVYATRARSLLSATAVLLASTLLALELLRGAAGQMRRTWLYALTVGLIMGEATWALNYWSVEALAAGVLLLLIFYLATGLAQQHLLDQLTRRVLLEFALAALIGLGLILGFAPGLR
ncbi:MAG: hypothetical protein ACE5MB_08355 [Anaerolineae bacterium]